MSELTLPAGHDDPERYGQLFSWSTEEENVLLTQRNAYLEGKQKAMNHAIDKYNWSIRKRAARRMQAFEEYETYIEKLNKKIDALEDGVKS